MLKKRIISACVFVPVMLGGAILGGSVLAALMLAVAIIGGYEYGSMLNKREMHFYLWAYCVIAVPLFLLAWLLPLDGFSLLIVLFGAIFLCMLLFMAGRLTMEEAGLKFLGMIYILFGLASIVVLRQHFSDGLRLVLLAFLIVWLTDSGAYLIGRVLGRHKLAPSISPNKTIEGAVGGVFLALVAALIYNAFVHVLPWGCLILLAVSGSVMGQLGDLMESALKRWADAKDSGRIMPGHGGVLDRFDSLLLIAPFMLLYLWLYTNFLN